MRRLFPCVGTTILFESLGGQVDKVTHLPELRFALGEPDVDTASVDSAAFMLEEESYFVRRVGSDGFKISTPSTIYHDRSNCTQCGSRIRLPRRSNAEVSGYLCQLPESKRRAEIVEQLLFWTCIN